MPGRAASPAAHKWSLGLVRARVEARIGGRVMTTATATATANENDNDNDNDNDNASKRATASEATDANPSALIRLAEKINVATRAAEASVASAVDHALTAGRLLIEAKNHVIYGDWETWLTGNCSVAPRTAQAYMRLAKKIEQLPPLEAQRVADLPLRDAIRAITTTPQSPPRQQRLLVASDAMRAADTLRNGATALRRAAERFGRKREMDVKQVQSLRRKLMAAIEVLDQLGEKSE